MITVIGIQTNKAVPNTKQKQISTVLVEFPDDATLDGLYNISHFSNELNLSVYSNDLVWFGKSKRCIVTIASDKFEGKASLEKKEYDNPELGVCCFCRGECNFMSQSCGTCSRSLSWSGF
jgi:hypothetical protein